MTHRHSTSLLLTHLLIDDKKKLREKQQRVIEETCDFWDTDYISDIREEQHL